MYCPECRAEYRLGFTHCSDCDVALEELPEEESSSDGVLTLTLLWECADQCECVGVCRDLTNADIPYKVLNRFLTRELRKCECSGTTVS
jgi:hypothetical protein